MSDVLIEREPAVADVLRVLLIEDSNNDALLMARALKQGGFDPQITRVQTEADMRAALSSGTFDVILTDWHLPAFSGLGAVKVAREVEPNTPLIMLSGVVGEETAVEAMKAGVQDYVMKDKLMRLVPAIRRELQEAQMRRERLQTQQALREIEGRFRMFMHHLPGAAYLMDEHGRLLFVNDYFRTTFQELGYEIGKAGYDLLPPRLANASRDADETVVRERREVQVAETVNLQGQERTYLTVRFPLPQADGRTFIGAIGIDITERKKAEDQLLALTEELRLRTRELEKKNVALSEVLGNIEAEKAALRQQIADNIEQRILPTLRRIHDSAPSNLQAIVEFLRQEMLDIAAPFVQSLQQKAGRLTSRELEVCRMIKHGLSTKEIAESLNLSPATVQKHREVIRRKLGISGADVNLHTFLQSL